MITDRPFGNIFTIQECAPLHTRSLVHTGKRPCQIRHNEEST